MGALSNPSNAYGFAELIGTSAPMQSVYQLINAVAHARHPVFIQGESGTGKELVARAIHAEGPLRHKPFVPIDCGALTPSLIESELFGHVRGAFSGADKTRQGLLAAARNGTVFLDEITELPLHAQAKLLRAIQEYEIRPIGGNEWIRLEARVVAATNKDIHFAMERGSFREDLYFRLDVVPLVLPPLRERKSDIPCLVKHFIERFGGKQRCITGASDDALARIISYDWPGNVRELENCVQRAIVLGSGPLIRVKDLPPNVLYSSRVGEDEDGNEPLLLKTIEQKAIIRALKATRGNCREAAKRLGIGRTTIYRKLKEIGLTHHLPLHKRA